METNFEVVKKEAISLGIKCNRADSIWQIAGISSCEALSKLCLRCRGYISNIDQMYLFDTFAVWLDKNRGEAFYDQKDSQYNDYIKYVDFVRTLKSKFEDDDWVGDEPGRGVYVFQTDKGALKWYTDWRKLLEKKKGSIKVYRIRLTRRKLLYLNKWEGIAIVDLAHIGSVDVIESDGDINVKYTKEDPHKNDCNRYERVQTNSRGNGHSL